MADMESKSRCHHGPRRTPKQIKTLLKAWERSGQTAHEFAATQGVALSTLWRWSRRQRSTNQEPRPPRWVEVRSQGLSAVPAGMAQVRMPDGLTVHLHRGFEVEPVAQLVQLLRKG